MGTVLSFTRHPLFDAFCVLFCRDELALAEDERQFLSERAVHHKEGKRIHCEECSETYKNGLCVMNKRYVAYLLVCAGFAFRRTVLQLSLL